jgi:PAS domain S-box-containing protein
MKAPKKKEKRIIQPRRRLSQTRERIPKMPAEVPIVLLKKLCGSQAEMRASLNRFVELYVFLPFGYVALDAQSVIREANLTAAHLLGVNRRQLLSKQLSTFITRECQADFDLHHQKVFTSWSRQACELQMRRKDGTTFTAGLESIAIRDGRPDQREWLVTFSDITDRKQAEQALRDSENELAAIYENAPLFMMLVNAKCQIRKTNKFVETVNGG